MLICGCDAWKQMMQMFAEFAEQMITCISFPRLVLVEEGRKPTVRSYYRSLTFRAEMFAEERSAAINLSETRLEWEFPIGRRIPREMPFVGKIRSGIRSSWERPDAPSIPLLNFMKIHRIKARQRTITEKSDIEYGRGIPYRYGIWSFSFLPLQGPMANV